MTPANVDCMTTVADSNVFRVGTSAFYDTFAGLIPCTVTGIKQAGYGFRCGPYDVIEFKLTADRGAYRKGEILTSNAMHVPPKKMIRRLEYSSRIITTYKYEPPTPA